MKREIFERFSKKGRLGGRLDEILERTERGELPRMDAGDLIGNHVVANLMAKPGRKEDETRLLFEAQRARARLYHQSSGATALEAAEALVEARGALRDLGDPVEPLSSLCALASGVLDDLREIGSRRTAWSVFRVLYDARKSGPEGMDAALVDGFLNLADDLMGDVFEPGIVDVILEISDWARAAYPQAWTRLARLLPRILEDHMEDLATPTALRTWLYARHVCLPCEGEVFVSLVKRVVADERRDQEARSLYNELLQSQPERKEELERGFEELAYANPDPDIGADTDLEALNHILSEHYPDAAWVWRNRALLFRRRGESMGALACLARAMEISGPPPELMAYLSPCVAEIGFVVAAHQFSRFVGNPDRARYGLQVLDLLVAEPSSREGRVRLAVKLEAALADAATPPEFKTIIVRRRAELLFEAGDDDHAEPLLKSLLREDATDEWAAIRLAEISFRRGDLAGAKAALQARFSQRVVPLEAHLKSRIAEAEGRTEEALRENARAMQGIEAAQKAGRDHQEKALFVLADRIRRMHGQAGTDGPLLAMLMVEMHAIRHKDVDIVAPFIERRAVQLSLATGDVEGARKIIADLVERRGGDTQIFIEGARACIQAGRLDEARDYLRKAEESGHGNSGETKILAGMVALQDGDLDAARAFAEAAYEMVPTADARWILAAVALGEENETEALRVLDAYRDDEGGTDVLVGRIHSLRGRLRERAGRPEEALTDYLAAAEADEGQRDARRRAGWLAFDLAMGDGGLAIDSEGLKRAVKLLHGFNDSESVVRRVLAESRLETDGHLAAEKLAASLPRTAGKAWQRIQCERIRRSLEAGDDDVALQVMEALFAEGELSKALERQLKTQSARLLRSRALRRAAASTGDGRDVIESVLADLEEASRRAPSTHFAAAALALAKAAGRHEGDIPLGRATPRSLALAVSLAGGERRKTRRKQTDGDRRRKESPDTEDGRLALLLDAIGDDTVPAREILTALQRIVEHGEPLPFPRGEMLALAAGRALATDDDEGLDHVLATGESGLAVFSDFRHLKAARAGEETMEWAHLLSLVHSLKTSLAPLAPDDEKCLSKMEAKITAVRETPSPAWASARLRTAGKRSRTHALDVLRFWERLLDDDPSAEALHHVALQRLSMAHEAESLNAGDMDLWRSAHEAWRRLLECEAFWEQARSGLAGQYPDDVAKDVVERIRGRIAYWLLDAQLRLAKQCLHQGDLSTAVDHGRLTMKSPLLELADASRIRDELFHALSGDLEKQIQSGRMTEALACIDHVIVADPSNPTAMREMVRVAATAVQGNLAVVDALTSPPDDSMVADTSALISQVLAVAGGCLDELLAAEVADRDLAKSLATCLRARAFVAWRRDKDVEAAAADLDRAIDLLDGAGESSETLRHLRSEVGLDVVRRTMEHAPDDAAGDPSDNPLEEAISEVDRLLDLDPGNVEVITQKAKLLLALQRDDEAEALARGLFDGARQSGEPARVRAAVELLHQVRSGREKLRYESRMQMVEQALAQRNFRGALTVFREATEGREKEPMHLKTHVRILLGMHKLEKARYVLEELGRCRDVTREHRELGALFSCLEAVSERGGDLYAAWELHERGKNTEASAILDEILAAKPDDGLALFLRARCAADDGNSAKAEELVARLQASRTPPWMKVMLSGECQS